MSMVLSRPVVQITKPLAFKDFEVAARADVLRSEPGNKRQPFSRR